MDISKLGVGGIVFVIVFVVGLTAIIASRKNNWGLALIAMVIFLCIVISYVASYYQMLETECASGIKGTLNNLNCSLLGLK